MATAFRVIHGRHASHAAQLGLLARLVAIVWFALQKLHVRRRADMEQLPTEYWFFPC